MSHDLFHDVRFFEHLLRIDTEFCRSARIAGCPHCGGRLDRADYARKPRGSPPELPPGYERRLSLCCDRCRRRVTPPSVRFMGRRVYLGVIVVLVSAMQQGPTPWRLTRLKELIGVDRRTVAKWREWWLESFPQTVLWRSRRAWFASPPSQDQLPSSILACFRGDLRQRIFHMLMFLSPLSAAHHGFCG